VCPGRGLEKVDVSWKKLSVVKQLLERVLTNLDKREKEKKLKETRTEPPPSPKTEKEEKKEDKSEEAGVIRPKDSESPVEKDDVGDLRERTFTFGRLFGADLRDDDEKSIATLERRRSTLNLAQNVSDDEDEKSGPEDDGNENDNDHDDYDEEATRTSKGKVATRFPEVTAKTFKEVTAELVSYFIANLEYDKEGDLAWRKTKESNGVVLSRKKCADESNHLDLIRGVVTINLPPQSVFEALRNERYFHLLHPDFLSCEQLEIFDSTTSIVYYLFKSTFFSDRDSVVLEYSNKIETAQVPTWIVLQQSVTHGWVGKPRNNSQFPIRCDVFVSGYHVEGIQGKDGTYSSCRLTHISQVDGKFPVGVGGHFRFGWARNLEKFRTFVDKNPLTKREATTAYQNLPPPPLQVTEASIKPGDVFAWAVTFDGKSFAHLEWDFDTQSSDIRWGLFLLSFNNRGEPESEQVVLPYGRFKSNVRPVAGKILLQPRETKGKYIMRWDNRYSRFTGKRLRFQAGLKYLPASVPVEELHNQHVSGEVYIDPLEIFKIPLTFAGNAGTSALTAHLVWDFKLASGSEISFGIAYKSVVKSEGQGQDEPAKKKVEELVPLMKIKGTGDSIKGGIPISGNPGLYVIVFDNSASKWTTKNLVYTISIRPEAPIDPSQIEEETVPLQRGDE